MNPVSECIPLFVGIVGHRDIAEEHKPRLKTQIKKVLEEKKAQCPNTQIVLLSPLAEGADRLAVYSAIECGFQYIAILPMPLEEYRKEFKTDESLQEFNDLLIKAKFYHELPSQKTSKIGSGKGRDDLYYNLGFFMARMSHLLIALWDGEVNNKTGGTANTVNMKINGLPVTHPYYKPRLRNMQTGSVYHILTPRKGQPAPAYAFSIKTIFSDNYNADKDNYKLLRNIDSFNRDTKKYLRKTDAPWDSNFDKKSNVQSEIQNTFIYHEIADALARHYQSSRFRALKLLLVLAVIAFVFFQVYVEFWDNPVILLMYPITIGLGVIWFIRANRLRFEQKHEDYRALSEAFRVQHYLSMIDKDANVSDYYLQKHQGELEWVTYVLRVTHFLYYRNSIAGKISHNGKATDTYKYINEHWVKEQANYYHIKSREYDTLLRKIKLIANGLFIGAIMASLILYILSVFFDGHSDSSVDIMHPLLVLLTHTFLVVSATLFGYNEKMIFEEQSKTFHQMYRLFSLAEKELSKAIEENNPAEARDIIRELGFESLMENADWLLLHRSRPMEIPKG